MEAQSDAARFFEGFADAFDSLYDSKRNFAMRWLDRTFRSDMFIRYALTFERLGDLSGKNVLDIGCGSGPYVIEALNRGAQNVTAVDPAPSMLALVERRLEKARLTDKCPLVEASFPGLDLPVHDHAIVMGVMDYVSDARTFLVELRPLVKLSAVLS